jgi:hypothetical protein
VAVLQKPKKKWERKYHKAEDEINEKIKSEPS